MNTRMMSVWLKRNKDNNSEHVYVKINININENPKGVSSIHKLMTRFTFAKSRKMDLNRYIGKPQIYINNLELIIINLIFTNFLSQVQNVFSARETDFCWPAENFLCQSTGKRLLRAYLSGNRACVTKSNIYLNINIGYWNIECLILYVLCL